MEEGIVNESENYRGIEKTYGYKEMVLGAINHARTIGAREMKEGFWIHNTPSEHMNNNEPIKYVGDTRKEYCQSVEMIYDLLYPKILKHKDIEQEMQVLFAEIEDLFLHRKAKHKDFIEVNEEMKSGNWDFSEFYWYKRIALYRKLFRRLCLFCEDNLGWMQEESIEE